MQRSIWVRGSIIAVSALSLLLVGMSAQAATRSMVGSLGVINPSVAPPFFFSTGPSVLGKKVGPYAPTDGWTTVGVAGTTAGTFVGRTVTLPANRMNFTGVIIRDFLAFPNVAGLTKPYSSVQQAATFMNGQGALAACPGPGCTSTGAGTAISWCPPLAENRGEPTFTAGGNMVPVTGPPGTGANQLGNWDCPSWQAGAGGGDRFLRIGISNTVGAPHFGGTFDLLRNDGQNTWRVLVQPGMDGIAEVSRSWMTFMGPWAAGQENFAYLTGPGNKGPRLFARLNENGAVTQTLGCVNPTGTPGGSFMIGSPILGPGSNCGTPTTIAPPGQDWGFRVSTADVEGSDPFPFGLVITEMPPGTPFNPNVGTQPTTQGFFFSRRGGDTVSGTNRNLVLVGGGVAADPNSGNAFFRILDLRLDMTVPEPAMGLGLVAGATALVALARRRRS